MTDRTARNRIAWATRFVAGMFAAAAFGFSIPFICVAVVSYLGRFGIVLLFFLVACCAVGLAYASNGSIDQ